MKHAWNFILLTVFFTLVVIITLGVFRGFEITDEGYYLLTYENPCLYSEIVSRYFIIVNKLFNWMGPQIYHYRLLTVLFNLLGSYIFFTGLWQYLNTGLGLNSCIWSRLSAFLFIAAGNLAAIFLLFKVLGYNDLNNFLLLSATGLVLLHLANRGRKVFSSILLLLAGFLLAFDIMVKFPSGIIYLFFLALFLFFEGKTFNYCNTKLQSSANLIATQVGEAGASKYDCRRLSGVTESQPVASESHTLKAHSYKFLIPGILAGFLVYFTFFETPAFFINSIDAGIQKFGAGSHSLGIIRDNYSYFIIKAIKFFFKYFSVAVLVFIITLVSHRLGKTWYTYIFGFFSFYLFLIAFLSSMVFAPLSSEGNIHVAMPAFLLIILFQVIFFLFIGKKQDYKPRVIFLGLFLTALPLIMAFGSAAPITMMSYLHMAPFFAVFFIFNLLSESPGIYIKTINLFFSLMIIVLTVSHLYFLYLENPFRINDDFFAQQHKVKNIKKLEHIRVDKKTKTFLDGLKVLMDKAGFKKDDCLVGYLMPGIVYIFDGVSPGAVYYDSHKGSKEKNINALVNSENILNKTYFLLPKDCRLDICEYIEKNDTLKNHEIIGELENPYEPNVLFVPNTPLMLYKPPTET